MTEAAIAEHVDDHVLVELLPELGCDLCGVDHGFGIVPVHVEDRRLYHQRDIGRVGRRPAEMRCRGETDLVVHHDMHRAPGAVTAQARQAETFRHDALTCKGRVAVEQDRQNRDPLLVMKLVLLGAGLAQHDRVHGFKVRRVRRQRQVHLVAVEFAVRRGAEVVLHVARPIDVVGLERPALEFVEDRAIGLGHHVGQHVQAAAVRHADHDFFHPQRAAALDDLFHRRDQAFAAIETEPFGPHVLDLQELLEALGLDHLVQDGFPALAGEVDLLAQPFDPLLQPAGLLGIGDVHVLQREGAAIGALHQFEDLADRCDLQAQHVVDEERPVQIGIGEPVALGIELGVVAVIARAQRIDIGHKVTADPVGADQHDRADGIQHRPLHLVVGQRHARGFGLVGDLLARGFRFRRRIGPHPGQRRGDIV